MVLKGLGILARTRRLLFFQAMSEDQLKAAETEATAQVEEGVEDISEDDLEDVAGGISAGFGISAGVRQEPEVAGVTIGLY